MRPGGAIDFAAELNPAQRAAVEAIDGPHLVIAGAGSGKTRTLVYRVARLVLAGVAPESILLLTFTRRAAQEMLRRAAGLLDERCRRVAGGTFHSFANLVLRRHAGRLGYRDGFTILDRSDAADIVGILRAEGGYERAGKRFPRKDTLLDLLSRQVNTGRPLAELLDEGYSQFVADEESIAKIGEAYADRKRRQNLMDYDDLLVNLRELLAHHEEVRRQLGATYRYVMVDEYQDTNRLQAHIAALLAASHGNLMVVGDDAQSIYSFRGADFRNIIDFPRIFSGCQTTILEQNYRSTQPILDLGNAILQHAREKYEKRLFTEVPGDARPRFVRTDDDYGEAEYVCRRVLELREEGVPLAEIAVLARAAWHSNSLEVELANRNIPFRKFGGLRFVEAAHVKDVCALLKIATNPLDGPAWFRFLQLFEGIGASTAQRLAQAVISAAGDLAVLTEGSGRRRYGAELRRLKEVVEGIASGSGEVSKRLSTAIDYYGELLPRKYDDASRRLRDLETLVAMAERYTSVDEFLSDLAIDPPEFGGRPGDGGDAEDEWMTVSTIHSAKGLEWHTVFVIHLNEGHFPSYRSSHDAASLEEERRLFYVAVTRAKRNLFLLKPEVVYRRGGFGDAADVTPFIAEIADFGRLTDEEVVVHGPGEEVEGSGEAAAGDPELLRRIEDYFG